MSWSISFNAASVDEALATWDFKVKSLPSYVQDAAKPELDAVRASIARLLPTPNSFWRIKSYGTEYRDEREADRQWKLFNVGLEIAREVFG